jgi:hypothetical protein
MPYPKWAPSVLCEKHASLEANPNADPVCLDTFHRLITREAMRRVWPVLYKWPVAERHSSEDKDQIILRLAYYVHGLRLGPSEWDLTTKAQRRKQRSEIISTARNLARLIRSSPYDATIPAYAVETANKNCSDLALLSIMHADQLRISELLDRLADTVEAIELEPSVFVHTKAHAKDKGGLPFRRYFVRTLSAYIRLIYDRPLHDVVATVASVILDDDAIDAYYVRLSTNSATATNRNP